MAGFLTRYFGTILRGPRMTNIKLKRKAGRLIRDILDARELALNDIPQEVTQVHLIRKALREIDLFEREADRGQEEAFQIGFDTTIQGRKALAILRKIEQEIEDKLKKHQIGRDASAVISGFEGKLALDVHKGESAERNELYLRLLAAIINIAEKGNDHSNIMAQVEQLFKTKDAVSRFAAFAFRSESRKTKTAVIRISKNKRRLFELLAELRKSPKPDVTRNLQICLSAIDDEVKEVFRETYLLWKRDFIALLVLLRILNEMEGQEMRYMNPSNPLMPRSPTEKNIRDIQEIKRKLADNCHTLAQGFRIIIGEEVTLEHTAERLKALAQRESTVVRRAA